MLANVVSASNQNSIPLTMLPYLVIGIVVTLFWNSITTIAIYWVSKKDRGIETVTRELEAVATKLVEERFRHMSHEVTNHVQFFKLTLDSLAEKVAAAEKEFDGIWEDSKDVERRLTDRLHNVQMENLREMQQQLEKMATKDDIERILRNGK